MIVGFSAGGGSDFAARIAGQKLSEALGQSVVIDNRTGANGAIAAELAAKAPADGYTLMMLAIAQAIGAAHGTKLPYDVLRDFTAVSQITQQPYLVVVTNALAVRTTEELIALAKAKPGEINYASSGVGAANHLAAELLSSMTGIKLTHVPYKGSGAALPALISGEVKLGFGPILPAIPHVKAGRIKALGVSGLKRSSAAPDIATIAEQGLPGFEVNSWYGLFVPAKTPRAVVMQLNRELGRILALPDVKERLSSNGVDPVASTPEALQRLVQTEKKVWSKVIRQANIKVQ